MTVVLLLPLDDGELKIGKVGVVVAGGVGMSDRGGGGGEIAELILGLPV